MRWGDGSRNVVRALVVPVLALEKALQENPGAKFKDVRRTAYVVKQLEVVPRKASKLQSNKTVPQTDTGGRDEYSKALERTREKELGKLVP